MVGVRAARVPQRGSTKFTQVDAGRGQNVTFDPLYLENFLELECHRCLMAQPWAVNAQAKKKSLTDDSSPVDSVGKDFAG